MAAEARDTVALIIVHQIDASGAVFAGHSFAFINIWFGKAFTKTRTGKKMLEIKYLFYL